MALSSRDVSFFPQMKPRTFITARQIPPSSTEALDKAATIRRLDAKVQHLTQLYQQRIARDTNLGKRLKAIENLGEEFFAVETNDRGFEQYKDKQRLEVEKKVKAEVRKVQAQALHELRELQRHHEDYLEVLRGEVGKETQKKEDFEKKAGVERARREAIEYQKLGLQREKDALRDQMTKLSRALVALTERSTQAVEKDAAVYKEAHAVLAEDKARARKNYEDQLALLEHGVADCGREAKVGGSIADSLAKIGTGTLGGTYASALMEMTREMGVVAREAEEMVGPLGTTGTVGGRGTGAMGGGIIGRAGAASKGAAGGTSAAARPQDVSISQTATALGILDSHAGTSHAVSGGNKEWNIFNARSNVRLGGGNQDPESSGGSHLPQNSQSSSAAQLGLSLVPGASPPKPPEPTALALLSPVRPSRAGQHDGTVATLADSTGRVKILASDIYYWSVPHFINALTNDQTVLLSPEISLRGGECRVRLELKAKVGTPDAAAGRPNASGEFPDPWSCEFFLRVVSWVNSAAGANSVLGVLASGSEHVVVSDNSERRDERHDAFFRGDFFLGDAAMAGRLEPLKPAEPRVAFRLEIGVSEDAPLNSFAEKSLSSSDPPISLVAHAPLRPNEARPSVQQRTLVERCYDSTAGVLGIRFRLIEIQRDGLSITKQVGIANDAHSRRTSRVTWTLENWSVKLKQYEPGQSCGCSQIFRCGRIDGLQLEFFPKGDGEEDDSVGEQIRGGVSSAGGRLSGGGTRTASGGCCLHLLVPLLVRFHYILTVEGAGTAEGDATGRLDTVKRIRIPFTKFPAVARSVRVVFQIV